MGNFFSSVEQDIEEIHDVERTEEILKEIEQVSEAIAKDVAMS